MTHASENNATDPGRLAAIDILMLDIVEQKFRRAVRDAKFGLRYLREYFLDGLAEAEELPGSIRAMYADMGKRVDEMLDVLRVQGSFFVDHTAIPEYAAAQNWRAENYEGEVPDIARVVEGINSAAADLRATLLQVGQKLSTLPPAMVAAAFPYPCPGRRLHSWNGRPRVRALGADLRSLRGAGRTPEIGRRLPSPSRQAAIRQPCGLSGAPLLTI
jgi:hypothetical protein